MLTKISNCLKIFHIRNFQKWIPTFVKAVTGNFLKKVSLKKKQKMWKEIGFAICTSIGSCVNEKQKNSLKFQISIFWKKKTKKRVEIWWIATSAQNFTFNPFTVSEHREYTDATKNWAPFSIWLTLVVHTTRVKNGFMDGRMMHTCVTTVALLCSSRKQS